MDLFFVSIESIMLTAETKAELLLSTATLCIGVALLLKGRSLFYPILFLASSVAGSAILSGVVVLLSQAFPLMNSIQSIAPILLQFGLLYILSFTGWFQIGIWSMGGIIGFLLSDKVAEYTLASLSFLGISKSAVVALSIDEQIWSSIFCAVLGAILFSSIAASFIFPLVTSMLGAFVITTSLRSICNLFHACFSMTGSILVDIIDGDRMLFYSSVFILGTYGTVYQMRQYPK